MKGHIPEKSNAPGGLRITIIEAKPMFAKGISATIEEGWPGAIINILKPQDISTPHAEKPDLILFSVESDPEKKAQQQVSALTNAYPGAKVILYDNQDDLKMLPYLLKLGISGYLISNFDAAELKLCIQTVFDDRRYISNEIVWDYLNREHSRSDHADPAKVQKLSKMEDVVANHLINGLSVTQIAKTMDRQLSTISTVKAKIFRKLRVNNIVDLKEKIQATPGQ
ncbi:response regulator transcription factor [Ravibacter arvi]|uniref:Response regulator transcription factor n=1 Tax=Ravibacter arvi TaxID=2051041 RepID=A0ABP8M267_9BACT